MRVLSVCPMVFASLLVSGGLGFGACPVAAQTAPVAVAVPARKTVVLEISNKAGLVTVREKDAAFLFAQVLASPASDLHIDVDPGGKDALGKEFWHTKIAAAQGDNMFAVSWKKSSKEDSGVAFSTKYEERKVDDGTKPKQPVRLRVVLGSDNVPSLANFWVVSYKRS